MMSVESYDADLSDADLSGSEQRLKQRLRVFSDRIWSKTKEIYRRVSKKPLFFAKITAELALYMIILFIFFRSLMLATCEDFRRNNNKSNEGLRSFLCT